MTTTIDNELATAIRKAGLQNMATGAAFASRAQRIAQLQKQIQNLSSRTDPTAKANLSLAKQQLEYFTHLNERLGGHATIVPLSAPVAGGGTPGVVTPTDGSSGGGGGGGGSGGVLDAGIPPPDAKKVGLAVLALAAFMLYVGGRKK